MNLRKKILPQEDEYLNWFNIIIKENNEIQGLKIKDNPLIKSWGTTINEENNEEEINYIYNEIQLLNDIKNCKDINTLCGKINTNKDDVINYLNQFIQFLKNNCKYEEILNEFPIIPNRNGNFKKIEELYSDHKNIIPEFIMNIYDSISEKKLNDELIDKNINVDYLGDILKIKDFDSISKYFNSYILENKNIENTKKYVVYPLLSIKTDNEEISKIYQFLIKFYELNQKQIETDNLKIPIDLWTYALKFWYEFHPKEIEKYENIIGLKNNLKENEKMNDNEILKWMNTYLDFLKLNSKDRNFENLKIFPNQNKDFGVLKDLHFDSGFPEEFKDILKKYCEIDKRKILLNKEILSYDSHKIMSEIDIAREIVSEFEKMEDNNEKKKNMAFEILCLYPNNKKKDKIRKYLEKIICPPRTPEQLAQNPIEYLGFAEIVYNKKNSFEIKEINTLDLNYLPFINYIIEQICEEISKFESYENIKNILFNEIEIPNCVDDFLIKIIKFIWDNQNCDDPIKSCIDINTSKKKIFLNMDNEFKSIDEIKIKEDFNIDSENEELLLKITSNELIKQDYKKKLLNENFNQQLLMHNNKFSKISLKSICSEIDQAIIRYVKENKNNNKEYDNNFYSIIKLLNQLKFKNEKKEELFPYYGEIEEKYLLIVLMKIL